MTYEEILTKAREAADAAYEAAIGTVAPMIVYTAKTPFDKTPDVTKPVYRVDGGVCGFAWLHFPKANAKFVNFLKKQGIGDRDYPKGYSVSSYEMCSKDRGQSMAYKEAAMRAAAKVMVENGIEVIMRSRID